MGEFKKLLIVDDDEMNRVILNLAFQDGYEIIEAENGIEALEQIYRYKDELCAVLLDIFMPLKDGYEVLKEMNDKDFLERIPTFLITSETNQGILEQGFVLGASDVILKPFNPSFIRRRIDNIVELYSHRLDLQHIIEDQMKRLKDQEKDLITANRSIIDTLSTAIEFRDCESGEHITRIRNMTKFILLEMIERGEANLTDREIELIGDAAVMHDVGKISIPDYILNKPGRLTEEEFELMKKHTILGCELLENIESLKKSELYEYCYDICRHHHERWDGNGYPDQLKGDEISLWAQAVSIADVFDALVSKRVYKKAYDYETAMAMIDRGECGVFSPKLLECFHAISKKLYKEYEKVKVKTYEK